MYSNDEGTGIQTMLNQQTGTIALNKQVSWKTGIFPPKNKGLNDQVCDFPAEISESSFQVSHSSCHSVHSLSKLTILCLP